MCWLINCFISKDERTLRQERIDLYIAVRNDVIGLMADCHEYHDYSAFNRYWNEVLRLTYMIPGSLYVLPENYFDVFEHMHLVKLSESNEKKFKLSILNRLQYNLFDVHFNNIFFQAQQRRNKAILCENTYGVQPCMSTCATDCR